MSFNGLNREKSNKCLWHFALGDTFWNGYYPFIDNQDSGINDAIKWAGQGR